MSRIACVDFDGVIHQYTRWDGNPPTGEPVPGIINGLYCLQAAGFEIKIFTARDVGAVKAWLKKYGLEEWFTDVTNLKVPAEVYFDDRAVYVPPNLASGLQASAQAFLRNGGFSHHVSLPRQVG